LPVDSLLELIVWLETDVVMNDAFCELPRLPVAISTQFNTDFSPVHPGLLCPFAFFTEL
jgi:hypothetical protein